MEFNDIEYSLPEIDSSEYGFCKRNAEDMLKMGGDVEKALVWAVLTVAEAIKESNGREILGG